MLSNCPDRLTGLLGGGGDWNRVGVGALEGIAGAIQEATAGCRPWFQRDADAPARFWRTLIVVDDAPRSLFDAVQRALGKSSGLEGPTASVALTGSGLRGQRDRRWVSEEGNLHLSVAVPVKAPIRGVLPVLAALPAVAVVDAIEQLTGERPARAVRWVNDVLVDGRKVAGVLTSTASKGQTLEGVCFGIGVNVVAAPSIAPSSFVPATGCLLRGAASGDALGFLWLTLEHVLAALERRLAELLHGGPASLVERYRADSAVIGRRVAVFPEGCDGAEQAMLGPPLAEGVVAAVNDDLTLRLGGVAAPVRGGRLLIVG